MNETIFDLNNKLRKDVSTIIKENIDKIQAMASSNLNPYFIRQFIYQELHWKYRNYIKSFEDAHFEKEYSRLLSMKKQEIEALEHFSSAEKLCFYEKSKSILRAGTEKRFHSLAVDAIREIVNSVLVDYADV